MAVLVLGAVGRTGGAVVQRAQTVGHQVTAFVHHAGACDRPAGVVVAEGDADAVAAVAAAAAVGG
ncbi:hypothetical protein [Geodermatophilus amargosae]|uniref:hypothetical protein n=1 Tax=Geodermatophilus amargosae TaxID=1296565 RepID=UPI0034DEEB3E